jgi:glutathione peroxidase
MMKQLIWMTAITLVALPALSGEMKHPVKLNFELRSLNDDRVVQMDKEYNGKVILVVNTASKCAFTGQYEGLEALYEKHREDGLVVLGFPSNDFANQEPGTEKQIQDFCRTTYGVQFPMFQKSRVTRRNADPLFRELGEAAGEYPKWNFHKYLIDREGNLVGSYGSFASPKNGKMVKKIESILF